MSGDSPVGLEVAARTALACMDLTSLGEQDTAGGVADLVARSASVFGAPAALCVWPRFVRQVVGSLKALHGPVPGMVPLVAAVANFPTGSQPLSAVLAEVRSMVANGAHEVDLVLDWRALLAGDQQGAAAGVRAVRQACRGATLKLIIESGELKTPELIGLASRIGLNEGVDFLKTSTGKTSVGATPEAARVMLQAIADHPRGARVGFKASGGVRTVRDAVVHIDLVREILGPQALVPSRLRIGASALLQDVQAILSARAVGSDGGDAGLPVLGVGSPAGSGKGKSTADGGHDGDGGGGGAGGDGGGGSE